MQRQVLHLTVKVKEGDMDMRIQELWQCQHWTIIPRYNDVLSNLISAPGDVLRNGVLSLVSVWACQIHFISYSATLLWREVPLHLLQIWTIHTARKMLPAVQR
ncbi:hypothetical protein DPMN_163042, partial [Dreissena polymorpha]